MVSEQTGLYVGALLTIMTWSYLYKENPLYRIAEHLVVGLTTAYGIGYVYHNTIKPTIEKDILQDGRYLLIIPILLGLMIYGRYHKDWVWLSRIPMAFWIGYGAGYTLAYQPAIFMRQIFDSFISFRGATAAATFNQIIYALVVISVLIFFIFTIKRDDRAVKNVALFGRYALMVAFGSAYGSITMAYLSLIIGRLQYVLIECLKIMK